MSAPGWSLMSSSRRTSSSTAMRRFMRARLEPAHRCGPAPKARWRFARAAEVEGVGLGELGLVAVGRRPVDQHPLARLDGWPPISVSCLAVRPMQMNGPSSRSSSSTAAAISSGRAAQQRGDLRLSAEADHHRAERPGGGVEAAEEEQLEACR